MLLIIYRVQTDFYGSEWFVCPISHLPRKKTAKLIHGDAKNDVITFFLKKFVNQQPFGMLAKRTEQQKLPSILFQEKTVFYVFYFSFLSALSISFSFSTFFIFSETTAATATAQQQ